MHCDTFYVDHNLLTFIIHRLTYIHVDLSILLQEITGDDDSDLYLAEREEELKNAQNTKRLQQMTVPGILGPHEQPESMQDELDLS